MGPAMDLLATRRGRRLLFGALYLSEGAPVGFLWWYLPTVLREEGVAVGEIASLSATLALPWALKFLWAPLVDLLRGPRFGFREWILATQVLMGLAFLPLFSLDLRADFPAVFGCLLLHAVAASLQDVAIDALAIRSTPEGERGDLNGWMTAGSMGGRALLSGGALALVGRVGPGWVYAGLLAVVWSSLLLVLTVREPAAARGRGSAREFLGALRAAAGRRNTWLGLLFAAVAAAGFEAVGGLAGPWMVDRGVPRDVIAFLFAGPFVAGIVLGGLLGGRIHDALGSRRSVAVFQALFAACVLALAALPAAAEGAGWGVPVGLLVVLYLAIGLYTASSYALFMGLTDRRLAATQFSAYMGATNLCESWSVGLAGRVAGASGYGAAFGAMALVSLAALPLLALLRPGREGGEGPRPG